MTYDSKSWELAAHFLEGDLALVHLATTDRIERLAVEIQRTVEDWIEDENDNYEPSEADLTRAGKSDAELRHEMAEARKLK